MGGVTNVYFLEFCCFFSLGTLVFICKGPLEGLWNIMVCLLAVFWVRDDHGRIKK